MGENGVKATKLLLEADKKMKQGSSFFGLFGGNKSDEACELYVKAANLFKIDKKWTDAGSAFLKAAELSLSKCEYKHEAATHFVDASNCFKKTNTEQAIDCLLKAVNIYAEMGRFSMAAKYYMNVAELYESDDCDLEKAMFYYEKAADYYKGEESKSSANKCALKVAQFAAQLLNYKKAASLFEEVGTYSAENALLKYGAKDHFFKAALCLLCLDVLDGKVRLTIIKGRMLTLFIFRVAIKRYADKVPSFAESREYAFLNALTEAMEEHNADEFTNAVKEYDKISRLDQWTTTILLRLKRVCGEGEQSDLL
ncbi:alpha soluble NSF attachment protein [Trichuris trichiura]|uniref:Alpha soluble NSF attachment protein n=1 Tax=Trichuris trichiura TaxID=36087 RepID=A0A077Z014_TRITR|nr:alpha soluble NSF attachment protein [Trichuris trichiura]